MSETYEISSAKGTPANNIPATGTTQAKFNSPSLSRAPLLENNEKNHEKKVPTPTSLTPRLTGSPVRNALRMTKLDSQDAWLPITESRNGNAYYAAFHTLCSGVGIQALVLPVAFTILGWTWGIICLSVTFIWQMYTLWLLVQLHESTESGLRYSRYLQLFYTTFGNKAGRVLAWFPIMYLSAGTCITLVILGGSTCQQFFQILCGEICAVKPLTSTEWFCVFTSAAVLLSQLPNLNSIAGVSLVGAAASVGYCTFIWVVSVYKGRLQGVSYDPIRVGTQMENVFSVLNALGIIAFAFRGHNLILEIQATMPSSEKFPSHVPMWRGVKLAYTLIAMCIFPLTVGGYWAYGQMIPPYGGMFSALYGFHSRDVSRFILGLTSLLVIISAVSSFQIYAMPVFDEIESIYTLRWKRPCPWWLRSLSRAVFGYGCFFSGVAIPFLASLAGLVGALTLPVTLAYPCFLWLKIKKPSLYSAMWCLNLGLGCLGMALSAILAAAGIYVIISTGIEVSFFKPH